MGAQARIILRLHLPVAGVLMLSIPRPEVLRAELATRSLAYFVRQGWETVEPETDLIWNWHLDAICEHLEAMTRQQVWKPDAEPALTPSPSPITNQIGEGDADRIQRLLINVPPGHMKSLLVSVFWPAWEWIRWPHLRSIFASRALELAVRDSIRCRDLLKSSWYQQSFRPSWKFKDDQDVKKFFANTGGGFRQCLSVGSGGTGFRGDKVVVDDPHDATTVHSELVRSAAVRWWHRTMSSRLNDPRKGCRLIIMQRLHEEDLSGDVLARGGYEHLCLPSEFDPARAVTTSIGWQDPREHEGELLFPVLFTRQVLDQAKKDLGSADYSGQHQQDPAPAGGLIFKKIWWRYWMPQGASLPPVRVQTEDGEWHSIMPEELPVSFDEVLQSWDMTFKDTAGADLVAGGVWGRAGSRAYLLDLVNEKLSFTNTLKAVRKLSAKWPDAFRKLVEDKANGPAVINSLEKELTGLIAVDPKVLGGSKIARANATTPFVEAGNVFLPHPKLFEWVERAIDELSKFPLARHDDVVDQFTQAIITLLVHAFGGGVPGHVSADGSESEGSGYVPEGFGEQFGPL